MRLSKEDPIIIIGAGLGGLSAAFSLQFHGYTNVKIYESSEQLSGTPSPLLLGAFHQNSLVDFEVDQWYSRLGKTWKRWTINWKNGTELAEDDLEAIRTASGYMPRTIAGPDLYGFLYNRLKEDTIVPNHTFISFTPQSNHVEVHFDRGLTHEAALLIGADGIQSRVRLQLLGDPETKKTEYLSCEALVVKTDLHPLDIAALSVPYQEFLGPGQSFSIFEVNETQLGVILTIKKDYLKQESLSENIIELYQDWQNPIPEVLSHIPASAWRSYEAYTIPPTKKWYLNRVVLLGDSIHPTLPFLGLSADMAMESGLLIGKILNDNRKNLDKALKRYEKRRKKRTKLAYKMSQQRLDMLDWENPITYRMRNWWIRQKSSHRVFKRYVKLNGGNYLSQ